MRRRNIKLIAFVTLPSSLTLLEGSTTGPPTTFRRTPSVPCACTKLEWTKNPSALIFLRDIYAIPSLLSSRQSLAFASQTLQVDKARFIFIPRFFSWRWERPGDECVARLRLGSRLLGDATSHLSESCKLRYGIKAGWADKLDRSLLPLLWIVVCVCRVSKGEWEFEKTFLKTRVDFRVPSSRLEFRTFVRTRSANFSERPYIMQTWLCNQNQSFLATFLLFCAVRRLVSIGRTKPRSKNRTAPEWYSISEFSKPPWPHLSIETTVKLIN